MKLPCPVPDYTTIYRRVMALNIQIDDGKSIDGNEDIIIAVDDMNILDNSLFRYIRTTRILLVLYLETLLLGL
ncbi:hypothetical protein HRbin05_00489 [archaeon HR05]|nr:hypothetical protein HRbin05_00489 [archaeon HR05]